MVQFTIAPSSSYEREHHNPPTTEVENGGSGTPGAATALPEMEDPVVGVMFGKTAGQQIRSSWWMYVYVSSIIGALAHSSSLFSD